MPAQKKEIDLDLALDNPHRARQYIKDFDWTPWVGPPEYLVHEVDQKIYLNDMNDEQAVLAAQIILNDFEKQLAWRQSRYEYWHH